MTVMVVVVLVVEPLTVIFVSIPRVGATTSLVSCMHLLLRGTNPIVTLEQCFTWPSTDEYNLE